MASRPCPAVDAYDQHMMFRCIRAHDGEAVYEADVDASLHNPTGRLHGGVLAGLADAAMGAAFLSLGGDGTNTDLDLRFLRPVDAGRLTATARTLRRGRRLSILTCEIHDDRGRLVATAQSQFLALQA